MSNFGSVGTSESLFVLNLCFPLDLWSLQGVGRSLCDYCLHTDLYLAFNYPGVSAACRCQYSPSFGSIGRGEGTLSGFHPTPCLSVCGPGLTQGCTALLSMSNSSPEQSSFVSLTFRPSVEVQTRLYGNMKLLSSGHVTPTNFTHQVYKLYCCVWHRNHLPKIIFFMESRMDRS